MSTFTIRVGIPGSKSRIITSSFGTCRRNELRISTRSAIGRPIMTIRCLGLALVLIAAAGAASGGKAQIVESPRHQVSNTSTLRIAPLERQSPVQNVVDLLNVRGTDAAVVPSD